jgi:hypothetical protein
LCGYKYATALETASKVKVCTMVLRGVWHWKVKVFRGVLGVSCLPMHCMNCASGVVLEWHLGEDVAVLKVKVWCGEAI